MQDIVNVTHNTFKEEVLDSQIPVLVDFWASWCPPCKLSEPLVNELRHEYRDRLKIVKTNVDQNPAISSQYAIYGVPTFILFHSGNEIERRVGAQSKNQLVEMISRLLQ